MSTLYHASTNKDLAMIIPKRTLSKNKYIGDFVFATADKILATMYLVPRGYATLMSSQDEKPNIVISANSSEYQINDRGGAVYELPSETFRESPQKDLSEYEMVSRESVKPLNKVVYDSSLLALQDAGITIHFVDEQTFNSLLGNPNQAELIKSLSAFKE